MINTVQEIELWVDNFEATSQSVSDLEQQYVDLLNDSWDDDELLREMIHNCEGLDWESIAYMTARLLVSMGMTCASVIEGYGDDE